MESICFQRGGQHVGNIVSGAPLLGHEAMPPLLEFAPAGCVSERIAHKHKQASYWELDNMGHALTLQATSLAKFGRLIPTRKAQHRIVRGVCCKGRHTVSWLGPGGGCGGSSASTGLLHHGAAAQHMLLLLRADLVCTGQGMGAWPAGYPCGSRVPVQ